MKIILASASPRRKKLLNQINLSFTVDPSDVDEHIDTDESPDIISENLALQKGKDVAARHPDSFIISADTIVCFNGQILGKPASKEEAVNMLVLLSSNSHDVFTGVNLGITDHRGVFLEQVTFHEKTKVTFAALELQEINYYVQSGIPMDKAGSYGIQDDWGALFVKEIEGDYNNVVGFPLHSFYQTVKKRFPSFYKETFILSS